MPRKVTRLLINRVNCPGQRNPVASLCVCRGASPGTRLPGGSSTSEASLGPFPGSMAKTRGTEPGLASAPAFRADQVAPGGGDTQAQSLASAGGGLAPGSPPVPCHLPGRPTGTFREDAKGLPAPALAFLPRCPHPGLPSPEVHVFPAAFAFAFALVFVLRTTILSVGLCFALFFSPA